jgi:hypothetical protein
LIPQDPTACHDTPTSQRHPFHTPQQGSTKT